MRLTDKKSNAIVLIGVGLFMLLNVRAWLFTNVIAPPEQRAEFAQKIASIEDRTPMIAGGPDAYHRVTPPLAGVG